MMFDTHCHLNFKTFRNKEKRVVDEAKKAGVNFIVVPGTDIGSSKKAIELAKKFPLIYAAVGIHPHHLYKISLLLNNQSHLKDNQIKTVVDQLEKLINHPKVIAVGEVGLDYHLYQKTKYQNYHIDGDFVKLQKEFFFKQIKLAVRYKKTLIVHNRQAEDDLLFLLNQVKNQLINIPVVFHCCQANDDLLNFAIKNHIFIGIDGDITYDQKKQNFVKKIPHGLLVLETDSPFLLPEPLKSQKLYPNQPKNLFLIAQFIARLLDIKTEVLIKKTTENGRRLFNI